MTSEDKNPAYLPNILGCGLMVSHIIIGLIQLIITTGALAHWLSIPVWLSFLLSAFVAWLPVVGNVIGIAGAHFVYGWSLWAAIALFAGPYLLIFLFALIAGAMERR